MASNGLRVPNNEPVVHIHHVQYFCVQTFSEEVDTIMLWAVFTLAFLGFLRVSEFTYSSAKNFLAVRDITSIYPQSRHSNIHASPHKTIQN